MDAREGEFLRCAYDDTAIGFYLDGDGFAVAADECVNVWCVHRVIVSVLFFDYEWVVWYASGPPSSQRSFCHPSEGWDLYYFSGEAIVIANIVYGCFEALCFIVAAIEVYVLW